MNNGEHYDFIIIGTGAGGGTLAWKLAPRGKRILLLERGPYVPREKDNWNPRAVNAEGKYNTKEAWRDKDGKELHPHTTTTLAGTRNFTEQLCFVCAKPTLVKFATMAAFPRLGRSRTTKCSPTTPRLNDYTTFTV